MGFEDAPCRFDAKHDITEIEIAVSLVFTITSDTLEDGSYSVITRTTNIEDTMRRVRTSDLRGKFYGVADITGYALLVEASPGTYPAFTFNKLTNPNCRYDNASFLIEFDEFTTYPNGLFNEEWSPSHALIDAYRTAATEEERADALAALKAEWDSHSVWTEGCFMLLSPPCCPCMIEILQYPVQHPGATTVHVFSHYPEGDVEYDDDPEDWTTVIPALTTRNCKSELGARGGHRFSEEDDETTPVTYTISSIVGGDETHDEEIEIRVNEDGVPEVAADFLWVAPDDVEYIFTVAVDLYGVASIVVYSVNGVGAPYAIYEPGWAVWQAEVSAPFRLTVETKSDGELGVWRIGFIGKYARTAVDLPVETTYHDAPGVAVVRPPWGGEDGYSDYLQFGYIVSPGETSFTVPDYQHGLYPLGEQIQSPELGNFLNVARCMSDNGESWSRTFDTTLEEAGATYHRVGHITYSW